MKEIEIKAKLRDKKVVMDKLAALGCVFEEPITQSDTVYAKNVGSLEACRSNDVFLRIRIKNNKKFIFTIKKRVANGLDAIEHETEISSAEQMHQAILMMGYKETVKVNKTRVITHYNGCEICVDHVDELGDYIEMEKLAEEGDSEKIQEEMFKFFESIGIDRADRAFWGYDVLILEKKDLSRENRN